MNFNTFVVVDSGGAATSVKVVRDGDYFRSEDREFLAFLPRGDDEARDDIKVWYDTKLDKLRTIRNEANFLEIVRLMAKSEHNEFERLERERNKSLAKWIRSFMESVEIAAGDDESWWIQVAQAAREYIEDEQGNGDE